MNLYDKNIEALKKSHPQLVEQLESVVVDGNRIKVLQTETGEPTVLYKTENGEEIYIHSSEDPVKRASGAADLVGKLGDEGIVVLCGFGLGYFAEEVYNRFEKSHVLIIYEATPELFKVALTTRDVSYLLKSERVHIAVGEVPEEMSLIHQYYSVMHNGKFLLVKHHSSMKLNEEAYTDFMKVVNDERNIAQTQIVTSLRRGREFVDADMDNIPSVIKMHGVTELTDLFKGRPAIVVSAGPSLDKNFHLLKQVKGKAVIIAVDSALAQLLPCDIIPDMVAAVEPSPKTMHMFKDNPMLKHVPLIALTVFYTDVLRLYPGPVFLNSSPGNYTSMLFSMYFEDKGYIPVSGGSVANLCFGIAENMGCSPIALIGQDLSFNREKIHSKGFADMLDMHTMDNAFVRQNIFGDDTYTRGDLFSYKLAFERKAQIFHGKMVNATEGGLPIEGADSMRLIDFINEYCSDLSKINFYSVLCGLNEKGVSYNLDGIRTTANDLKTVFEDIKKNSSRVLKNISILEKMKEKGEKKSPEFNRILEKIESIIDKVRHPSLDLLVGYNYKLELYLEKMEVKEIDEINDKWDKLDKQLERGKKYYGEIVKTIGKFNKKLSNMIVELETEEKITAIMLDEKIDRSEKLFRVGMIYKKAAVTARSVTYFESLLNEDQQSEPEQSGPSQKSRFLEAHAALAEIYMKQFRFYEAREVLQKVLGHGPEAGTVKDSIAEKVKTLLEQCNEKISVWEKRKVEMKNLMDKSESEYGGNLDSGYFYFRVEDYKRAEKAYMKTIESYEAANESKGLVEAYYGLAHTYIEMDDLEKSVVFLEKALEKDPVNPVFYRDLGLIAYQNNDMKPAELFLSKAIELAPEETELYKQLAGIYMNIGEREKAIALYENALQNNGENPEIQQDLAIMYKEAIANVE
jgi:Tfp pilus assembly protein PilF